MIDTASKIQVVSTLTSDGSMQAIVLPTLTFEAQTVIVQVHNGVTTDFTTFNANPPGFHFSTSGHATNPDYLECQGTFAFDVSAPGGATVGYVRAATGQYVTVGVRV